MTQQYLMVQNPGTTDLSWQYELDMPSNGMAIDYAKRIACQIDKSIDLYLRENGDWSLLSRIRVRTETYAVID